MAQLTPNERNEINFLVDSLMNSWLKTPSNAIEHMKDRLKTNPPNSVKGIVEALLKSTTEELEQRSESKKPLSLDALKRMRDKLLTADDEYQKLAGQALTNALEFVPSNLLQR